MDIKIFEQVFGFCGINFDEIKILFRVCYWYFCFLIKDARKQEVEALSFLFIYSMFSCISRDL